MRRSLVARVTRAYVGLAAALVVFTCFASMAFGLHEGVARINDELWNLRAEIKLTADALAASGRPFTEIARVVAGQQQPGVMVQVLDTHGRVVAGTATPNQHTFTLALATLFGLHPLDVTIPGGSVHIARDSQRFADELRGYALFNIPIALVAILLAWWVGRRITFGALRPLAGITSALDALADGDFSAKSIMGLDDSEVALLADAFNRATATVSRAMSERDNAQTELRRFVADAGHELRTPLTVIIGYVDAMRHGVVADRAAMTEILDTVHYESQRIRRIVEDLITLARLDHQTTSRRETIALRDIVTEIVDALPPPAKQRTRDAGGDAIVQADVSAIHRAVRNVVDNALRYTRGIIEICIGRDGTFALLTVSDDGPGMRPEDVQAAFERFYRGQHEAEIEGTGLGLAIVKTAVEASGGNVQLLSSPEDGTKVSLWIPLASSVNMLADETG